MHRRKRQVTRNSRMQHSLNLNKVTNLTHQNNIRILTHRRLQRSRKRLRILTNLTLNHHRRILRLIRKHMLNRLLNSNNSLPCLTLSLTQNRSNTTRLTRTSNTSKQHQPTLTLNKPSNITTNTQILRIRDPIIRNTQLYRNLIRERPRRINTTPPPSMRSLPHRIRRIQLPSSRKIILIHLSRHRVQHLTQITSTHHTPIIPIMNLIKNLETHTPTRRNINVRRTSLNSRTHNRVQRERPILRTIKNMVMILSFTSVNLPQRYCFRSLLNSLLVFICWFFYALAVTIVTSVCAECGGVEDRIIKETVETIVVCFFRFI